MPDRVQCQWHLCAKGEAGKPATFTPARRNQHFCSAQCRVERAAWRQRRGSILVDPLIEGDWTKLRELRDEIIKETGQ